MSARIVLLANPANRRATFFLDAVRAAGLDSARVVSWLDLLEGRIAVEELFEDASILRIDSPGEDFAVDRLLIAAGADEPDPEVDRLRIPRARALELVEDRGRILYPRQLYLGFCTVLKRIARAHREHPTNVHLMSAPEDTEIMFDKALCQKRLSSAGVPIPKPLVGTPRSFQEVEALIAQHDTPRVFIKLRTGSSASGVIAYETNGRRRMATTSVELVRDGGEVRLYNSLRVRRYTDEHDIATIVDVLCREGAHVEAWMPKAGIDGHRFDLRVVVIGGRARHVVVRMAKGPMTNLHLGNKRGSVDRVRELTGEGAWTAALQTAERATALFPASSYAGVDLLITPDFVHHVVLELNAYGDLLPGVESEGEDTYTAELREAQLRVVSSAARRRV